MGELKVKGSDILTKNWGLGWFKSLKVYCWGGEFQALPVCLLNAVDAEMYCLFRNLTVQVLSGGKYITQMSVGLLSPSKFKGN